MRKNNRRRTDLLRELMFRQTVTKEEWLVYKKILNAIKLIAP